MMTVGLTNQAGFHSYLRNNKWQKSKFGQKKLTENTIQLKGYSCTDADGTSRQGQTGVEEFCQWPVLWNGLVRPQIRSETPSNRSSCHHLIFDIPQWYKTLGLLSLWEKRFLPLLNLVTVVWRMENAYFYPVYDKCGHWLSCQPLSNHR